jgi:hypothetical protein
MDDSLLETYESPQDFGKDEKAIARRWKLELRLADRREKGWREKVKNAYDAYTPPNPLNNSFNILWPNTETLEQAVYNSLPEPQCKRRYADEDPLGMKVAQVVTRALEYTLDCTNFHKSAKSVVLATLIAGRGVLWERYVPTFTEGIYGEDVTDEKPVSEIVNYEDFRILCEAKVWEDVTAIGRRHRLNRKGLIKHFGEEIGNKIKLEDTADQDVNDSGEADIFKTAEVWEIWNKEEKEVLFINNSLDVPCKIEKDPMGLEKFFPTPEPLYAIEKDNSLIPTSLYCQYQEQAKELNLISMRINKLINAMRVRGIYDATLTELQQLTKMGDDQLVPAQNVMALIERGGLDKAIWMMPIDTAAMVLKELYVQREATKQVIYELTGISDIMRSATDPKETFGAQRLKTTWGTQRLQRLQGEVQRYMRDVIRIKAEIISQKFTQKTLADMTLVDLPYRAEVEVQQRQAMMQYQQQAMMAQQQGQQVSPPPPMPPSPITWEDVMENMRNDKMRSYHVSIETDSTISATQDNDMSGLRDLLTGITELIQGLAPAVQAGAIPIEAVKAIMGVILRRAKMGSAVEEALEKMQKPPPSPDPEQIKAQAAQQQQQMIIQQKQQEIQMKMEHEAKLAQMQADVDLAREKSQAQGDAAKEQYRMQADMQIEQNRMQVTLAAEEAKLQATYAVDEAERNHKISLLQLEKQNNEDLERQKLRFEQWKTQFEAATRVVIAQISAQSSMNNSLSSAEQAANTEVSQVLGMGDPLEAITSVMVEIAKPEIINIDEENI